MSTMRRRMVEIGALLVLGACCATSALAQANGAAPRPTQDAPRPQPQPPETAAVPERAQRGVPAPIPPGSRAMIIRRGVDMPLAVTPDRRLDVSGFSAVLVLGDMQRSGGTSADDMPAPAKKALADMKDFLPFKNYQLLDVAWLAGNQGGTGVTLRLRGPGEQPYQLDIYGPDRELGVGVRLSETSAPPETRLILNTTFRMTIGESVVVGTSRLNGGKALILLLTAVPVGQSPRP